MATTCQCFSAPEFILFPRRQPSSICWRRAPPAPTRKGPVFTSSAPPPSEDPRELYAADSELSCQLDAFTRRSSRDSQDTTRTTTLACQRRRSASLQQQEWPLSSRALIETRQVSRTYFFYVFCIPRPCLSLASTVGSPQHDPNGVPTTPRYQLACTLSATRPPFTGVRCVTMLAYKSKQSGLSNLRFDLGFGLRMPHLSHIDERVARTSS